MNRSIGFLFMRSCIVSRVTRTTDFYRLPICAQYTLIYTAELGRPASIRASAGHELLCRYPPLQPTAASRPPGQPLGRTWQPSSLSVGRPACRPTRRPLTPDAFFATSSTHYTTARPPTSRRSACVICSTSHGPSLNAYAEPLHRGAFVYSVIIKNLRLTSADGANIVIGEAARCGAGCRQAGAHGVCRRSQCDVVRLSRTVNNPGGVVAGWTLYNI